MKWMPDEIYTSRGQVIIVSPEDWREMAQWFWNIGAAGYAQRNIKLEDGRRALSMMHREIIGCTRGDGMQVDHRNLNRLDNRRDNLRKCSQSENLWNRVSVPTSTSRFKGVSWCKRTGKWHAQIKCYGASKHLGYFDSEERAHEVYCLAADLLHGEYANHGRQA
ncbi:TPA: HNH endonuclease [Burkholderia cepacia]|nr:HNH endonuclease [Burkholderia cepacia]